MIGDWKLSLSKARDSDNGKPDRTYEDENLLESIVNSPDLQFSITATKRRAFFFPSADVFLTKKCG
jgi:hypothetical protein